MNNHSFTDSPLSLSINFWSADMSFSNEDFNILNDGNNNYSLKENTIANSPHLNPTPNPIHYFSTNTKFKIKRRDYYIKKIKVFSLSKWLIETINYDLKNTYSIKQKIQKPSQTLITETKIIKNRLWLDYTIENFLTNDLNEHYDKEMNAHWEKKKCKNKKIFELLHMKHEEIFLKDKIFQRTLRKVIVDYGNSEQFRIDKNIFKSNEDKEDFEEYLKGSDKKPGFIEYFLKTPGNKEKMTNENDC